MTRQRFRVINHDEYDYELGYIADSKNNFKKLDLYDICDLLNDREELISILKRESGKYRQKLEIEQISTQVMGKAMANMLTELGKINIDDDNLLKKIAEIEGKTVDELIPKTCQSCSYKYKDGFCMLHCFYTNKEYTCSEWTRDPIEFNYDRIYRLCKQYITICEMFNETEKLMKKYPDELSLSSNIDNDKVFLNCCLNDLHREMSLWQTRQ